MNIISISEVEASIAGIRAARRRISELAQNASNGNTPAGLGRSTVFKNMSPHASSGSAEAVADTFTRFSREVLAQIEATSARVHVMQMAASNADQQMQEQVIDVPAKEVNPSATHSLNRSSEVP